MVRRPPRFPLFPSTPLFRSEVEARLVGPVGCTSVTWLDSPGLAAAIRSGFAPGDRAKLAAAELAADSDPRVAAALPMAAAGDRNSTRLNSSHANISYAVFCL